MAQLSGSRAAGAYCSLFDGRLQIAALREKLEAVTAVASAMVGTVEAAGLVEDVSAVSSRAAAVEASMLTQLARPKKRGGTIKCCSGTRRRKAKAALG